MITEIGNAKEKFNSKIFISKLVINSCIKTPVDPTNPKLTARLGMSLKLIECKTETKKSQKIEISNFELP